jgi:hypothetical protein
MIRLLLQGSPLRVCRFVLLFQIVNGFVSGNFVLNHLKCHRKFQVLKLQLVVSESSARLVVPMDIYLLNNALFT